MALKVIDFQTGSGRVACGLPVRDPQHPDGWDMGNATVDVGRVTCTGCLPGRAGHLETRADVLARRSR